MFLVSMVELSISSGFAGCKSATPATLLHRVQIWNELMQARLDWAPTAGLDHAAGLVRGIAVQLLDPAGGVKRKKRAHDASIGDVRDDGPVVVQGIEIVQLACRMLSEAIDPIGTKCLAAGNGFDAAAAAVNHGIFSIHFQDRLDIARAVGIEPVNRNCHRVK